MDIQELCKAYSSFFDVDATFSSYGSRDDDKSSEPKYRNHWYCKIIINEKVIFKSHCQSDSATESEKQAVSKIERCIFNHAAHYGIKLLNECKL